MQIRKGIAGGEENRGQTNERFGEASWYLFSPTKKRAGEERWSESRGKKHWQERTTGGWGRGKKLKQSTTRRTRNTTWGLKENEEFTVEEVVEKGCFHRRKKGGTPVLVAKKNPSEVSRAEGMGGGFDQNRNHIWNRKDTTRSQYRKSGTEPGGVES